MIIYSEFTFLLSQHPDAPIDVYLPNKIQIPAHYHVTDVGSINRYFIDCGGQTREEHYVQIQLWLGKDQQHRLNSTTLTKILERSQEVLDRLPDLMNSHIHIEYKIDFVVQCPVTEITFHNNRVVIQTSRLTTQCLAAKRHEQEKAAGKESGCCISASTSTHSSSCCPPVAFCC